MKTIEEIRQEKKQLEIEIETILNNFIETNNEVIINNVDIKVPTIITSMVGRKTTVLTVVSCKILLTL